jgi:hypothetical protein
MSLLELVLEGGHTHLGSIRQLVRRQIDLAEAAFAYQAAELVVPYILEILVCKLAASRAHVSTFVPLFMVEAGMGSVNGRTLTPTTPGTSWQASIAEHAGLAPWWWPACVPGRASERHMALSPSS